MNPRIFYNNHYISINNLNSLPLVTFAAPSLNDHHLAVSWNEGEVTYAILSDLNQPAGFLETHKIFSASFVHQLILSHAFFLPLSNAIEEANLKDDLKPETFTLLVWYYLTKSSISVPFIEKWLMIEGYSQKEAAALALSVYMSRTEREDDSAGVFGVSPQEIIVPADESNKKRFINFSTKENYFQVISQHPSYSLVYDKFNAYKLLPTDSRLHVINCSEIPETSLLVEDHHHIILGLSTLLCEVMTLCDFGAPTFNTFIMHKIRRSETTYMSLGTFLHKYADDLVTFIHQNDLKLSLKLMDNQFIVSTVFLEKGISCFSTQNSEASLLPLYLDIEKA